MNEHKHTEKQKRVDLIADHYFIAIIEGPKNGESSAILEGNVEDDCTSS